jgi:signal transduction histidine kinase
MLGHTSDELVGRQARSCFGERYGSERYESQVETKSGPPIVIEVCTRRIECARGRQLGSFAVLMDVTERARAQAALRRSESDLRLLSAQLWAAQEHERKRIARELHDGIGQALGGIKFGLENCSALVAIGSGAAAIENIETLTGKIRDVLEEVRRIAMDLRPAILDDFGILATLGWFSREFRSIYGKLNLETIVDLREEDIPPAAKTAIFRIAQEATNNVVTHAHARNIVLTMYARDEHVELRVQDDGIGFDPASFTQPDASGRGLGLTSMRERAEASGGRFTLQSTPGQGTTVTVTWPRAANPDDA